MEKEELIDLSRTVTGGYLSEESASSGFSFICKRNVTYSGTAGAGKVGPSRISPSFTERRNSTFFNWYFCFFFFLFFFYFTILSNEYLLIIYEALSSPSPSTVGHSRQSTIDYYHFEPRRLP